jgi:peptide/nickel transport system ATP-binding protein
MYAGRLVEIGPTRQIVDSALHPYTRQLIDAVPRLRHHWKAQRVAGVSQRLAGGAPAGGCPFLSRCPEAQLETCSQRVPELAEVSPGHQVACRLGGERSR